MRHARSPGRGSMSTDPANYSERYMSSLNGWTYEKNVFPSMVITWVQEKNLILGISPPRRGYFPINDFTFQYRRNGYTPIYK